MRDDSQAVASGKECSLMKLHSRSLNHVSLMAGATSTSKTEADSDTMPGLSALLLLPDCVLEHVVVHLTAPAFFALAQSCRSLNAQLQHQLTLWYDASILQENLQWAPHHKRLAWLNRQAARHGAQGRSVCHTVYLSSAAHRFHGRRSVRAMARYPAHQCLGYDSVWTSDQSSRRELQCGGCDR